jgi:hypothetical protein
LVSRWLENGLEFQTFGDALLRHAALGRLEGRATILCPDQFFFEPHRPFKAPKVTDRKAVRLPPYYPDHPVAREDWA